MQLKRFLPPLAVCLIATAIGTVIRQTQPDPQPEAAPFSWDEFQAAVAREDAAAAGAFAKNDDLTREEKSAARVVAAPFLVKQTTGKKSKRGKTMATYIATLAGDVSYRGTYNESGTYNSKPAYTNGTRWLFWETAGYSRWAMNDSKSDVAIPYEGSNDTDVTTGAWNIGPGGGDSPAPTVSLDSVAIIVDLTPAKLRNRMTVTLSSNRAADSLTAHIYAATDTGRTTSLGTVTLESTGGTYNYEFTMINLPAARHGTAYVLVYEVLDGFGEGEFTFHKTFNKAG